MSELVCEHSISLRRRRHARVTCALTSAYLVSFLAVAHAQSEATSALEEVIVSAQKRSERLQDVPVPVSAITSEALTEANQVRLQDYYAKVPGLGLALMGDGGSPIVTIRGIATGSISNPTVGVVVDDVPYGSSTSQGGGQLVPDIDPNDLSRIEVLRGPQGTLYGANSLGGLLKFVTVDEVTDTVRGSIRASITDVHDGEDVGYSFRGAVSVPFGSTFALRASGYTGEDPGYVDNTLTGERDINFRENDGGRISALWQPSDDLSLKISALVQESERLGADEVDRTLGALRRSSLRGTGGYMRKTEAYSATLNANLGKAELTSASGYSVDKIVTQSDVTSLFRVPAQNLFQVSGAALPFLRRTEKLTQEVRLSVPIGDKLEWLIGGFYTDEDVDSTGEFAAVDPATGRVAGLMLTIDTPSKFEEYAAFTNLTFYITDKFDIQFGGRFSENRQTFSAVRFGPLSSAFFGANPSVVPDKDSKDSPFTYLVTPRYKFSSDLMAYARLASGYRPGGPNISCGSVVASFPCTFGPDKTLNYELGFKGSTPGRALSFDASVYYIDWKDIQIFLVASGLGYTDNVARATSQGVELSLELRPFDGLKISSWVAWNDAELARDIPPSNVFGRRGDRLPYSAQLSAHLSIDDEFSLGSQLVGFVGAAANYVDDRKGNFRSTALRETFPSYTQVDVHAGVRYDTWEVSAFVNNAADERGVLRSGFDAIVVNPALFTYIQPRTVGLSLTKTF